MIDRSKDKESQEPGELVRDHPAEIRWRAEERMAELLRHRGAYREDPHVDRLVHELGVHQIELEMQNEELLRTQAALQASRDRYRLLYEQTPVGYLTLALDGAIVECNPVAGEMFGISAHQLVKRRLVDLVAAEDRLRYQECNNRLLRDQRTQYAELRMARAGGAAWWAAVRLALVVGEADEPPQYRVAIDDVSARVALQEDRARLAAIVSSSVDAIVGRDIEGRITSWNGGAARLFGLSAEEMIGRGMEAVVPETRRAEDAALLARIRRGEKVEAFESERCDRAGNPIPMSISLSPIRDERGRVVGSSLIGRDIRSRKHNELALHNRLRQLDLLSQAGQALIMGELGAPATQHELFDRVRLAVGAEIYLNYRIDHAVGALQLVSEHGLSADARARLESVTLDDALCGLAARRRAPLLVEELHSSDLAEARTLRELGVRSYVGFPLLSRGQIAGVASFASTTRERFRDGDLHVIQTVCDQVSAMLEREGLLAELHEREQSLKLADRRKDDFIATLAHELRNPLAPIRNAVSILRAVSLPDPQMVWCRDVIDRQVAQMTRLLEDLLDVSRVTRNKIELRRERFDLRRAIEAAVEATRPLVESQKHRLTLDLPDQRVAVFGDEARLTQVFANLLNNAAKYTDAGGSLRVEVQRADDHISVTVRDNGIGIEPAQLAKVFDMFAQLKPALERSRGGLGIGLSLSRGLVEQHGGRIEARSAGTGHGSEFTVYLPVAYGAADAALEPHDHAAPSRDLTGRRVLIIDDNADAAQTLATMLGLHGLAVRAAFSGKDGLRLAEEWRPDAAVVDIGMPQFNGYEVCRRIREQPWGDRILMIACTGWGQHEDRLKARAAGFDFHLVKPVAPADVLAHLGGGGSSGAVAR